jgi:hypothetical protein
MAEARRILLHTPNEILGRFHSDDCVAGEAVRQRAGSPCVCASLCAIAKRMLGCRVRPDRRPEEDHPRVERSVTRATQQACKWPTLQALTSNQRQAKMAEANHRVHQPQLGAMADVIQLPTSLSSDEVRFAVIVLAQRAAREAVKRQLQHRSASFERFPSPK